MLLHALTSQSSAQKLNQYTQPGMKVFLDEHNYAVKPAIYRNVKLGTIINESILKKLAAIETPADVQKTFTEVAVEIDMQLSQSR